MTNKLPKRLNKEHSRSVALRFKTEITALIYNSLVHDVPKHRVYGQIKREIAYFANGNPGISLKEKGYLWATALKIYSNCSKQAYSGLKNAKYEKTYAERVEKRSKAAFEVIKRNLINSTELSKAENDVLTRIETRYKDAKIDEMLKSDTKRVFYLCDMHENCAKDHAAYQGRLYIREDWELYVDDKEVASKINAYLHNHPEMKVETLEWVLGYKSANKAESPYLVRRPNCKHQIVPIRTEEVLGMSVKKLLTKNNMIHKHPEPRQNDPERLYRAYRERKEALQALWQIAPSEILGKELSETKHLEKKWARMRSRA